MDFEKVKKGIENFFSKNKYLKIIGLIILGTAVLFGMNLIISRTLKGGNDFYVKWSTLDLLQQDDPINPYGYQAFQKISENAEHATFLPLLEEDSFSNPIFSLFLYYPFNLIKDFETARAVWMTLIMIFFLYVFWDQYIKDQEENTTRQIILALFLVFNVFSVTSFLAGDLLTISFALVILAFKNIREEKYELAGIYCALATIVPGVALVSMVIFAILSLKERKIGFLIWFLITTALLCFAGFLIQDNWIVQFLQSNIKKIQNIFSDLNLGVGNIGQTIEIVLPILVIITEWIRSINQLDQPEKKNWLFHLTLVLFPLILGSQGRTLSILFLPAWLQIFNEWKKRESANAIRIGFFNIILYIALGIIIVLVKPGILIREEPLPQILFWIAGLHVFLNMYWIRPWIFRDTMRNFIKPE